MGRRSSGALSLPRSGRLRGAAAIQALFQGGVRDERRSFVTLWLRKAGERRVCVAVSRRVGGAVARNRARRRIREAYRQFQHRLPPGTEVVFIARAGARTRSFPVLLDEMRQAVTAIASAVRPPDGGRAGQ